MNTRFPPFGTRSRHDEVMISEILEHAIGVQKDRWSRSEQLRVSAWLRHNGWAKKQRRVGGAVQTVYYRAEDDA
jgi:hypothetical protein